MNPTPNAYERDYFGWTREQVDLLRAGRMDALDTEHLIEEIESMGNSERREFESRLEVLLQHLLKWRHQPARRCQSWRLTIAEQRRRIERRLQHSPSLQAIADEALAEAYEVAILAAARETGLDETAFPAQCPWTFATATDPEYLPE